MYLLLPRYASGITAGLGITKQSLQNCRTLARFLVVPVTLAILTAADNLSRFHNFFGPTKSAPEAAIVTYSYPLQRTLQRARRRWHVSNHASFHLNELR
jgi:hypothetical protein